MRVKARVSLGLGLVLGSGAGLVDGSVWGGVRIMVGFCVQVRFRVRVSVRVRVNVTSLWCTHARTI